MTYRITPIQKRKRKKRTHYNSAFIVSMVFLVVMVVGLTISLSIRACSHRNDYIQEVVRYAEPGTEPVNTKYQDVPEVSLLYEIPDSVIRICMPSPLVGISEQIIRKTSYIVSYNKDTKIPNWVAWYLTSDHTDGPYPRLSNFYEDEDVPAPRATLEDYKGSGWTRGHMCPAGDNKWDEDAMYDTFALTNVCPQNANLNSGLWNNIEMDCRKWAKKFGDIYIVCGPILMRREHEIIGNNEIVVPEAFFKVVLCLNGEPKGFGFVVRNTDGNKKRDLYYNSIDQVERITGMDFFPALPDAVENVVEAEANIDEWN